MFNLVVLFFSVLTISASTITTATRLNEAPISAHTLHHDVQDEVTSFDFRDIHVDLTETQFSDSKRYRSRNAVEESDTNKQEPENTHEKSRYMKQGRPLFEVLLVVITVNFFTLAGMLFFIPYLQNNKRWHWSKSLFWVPTRLIFEKNLNTGGTSDDNDDFQEQPPQDEKQEKRKRLMDIFVPSFACGITLATAFFLILPESLLLIQEALQSHSLSDGSASHEGYSGVVARFGMLVLAGYALPQLLFGLLPRSFEFSRSNVSNYREFDEEKLVGSSGEEVRDGAQDSTLPGEKIVGVMDQNGECNFEENGVRNTASLVSEDSGHLPITYRTFDILLRDAVFNFFHGILMGTAYMSCSNAMSICISIVIVFQRISQEATSYVLLTKYVGLWFSNALLFNVWTGLTCVGGAMVILGGGFFEYCIGLVLASSVGFLLHTASNVYLRRIYSIVRIGMKDRVLAIFFFAIGAAAVGATLNGPRRCAQVRITSSYS